MRPLGRGAGAETDHHIVGTHHPAQQPRQLADVIDGDGRRVPRLADAFRHVVLVDALQRLLAGRVERANDDVVGLVEAGAELAEEVVHARIAVRLEHGDDAAAREGAEGRVIAVVQPHRYTRLRDLMEEFQGAFNDADIVYVTPVYPAGEDPIEGVDAAALAEGLKQRGHRAVKAVADLDDLCLSLRDIAAKGDMVICLGAGTSTEWAHALPGLLGADEPRRANA